MQVSLRRAALDVPVILQRQRIYLLGVPHGLGHIVFTAEQFGTFMQHALMLAAAATAVQVRHAVWQNSASCDVGPQSAIVKSYVVLQCSKQRCHICLPLPSGPAIRV